MGGILRRASGVYVARLMVPERHRQSLGKLEFIASTGTREIAVARIVAGQLVAEWRRRLHNLDRLNAGMDVLQLSLGSPLLLAGGYTPLVQASQMSGFDPDELLRHVAEGKLGLYMRASALVGHVISEDDCERYNGPMGVELTVPTPAQMPDHVSETAHHGMLKLRESKVAAAALLHGQSTTVVLLDLVPASGRCFAPLRAIQLDRDGIELDCAEVERLRAGMVKDVTPAQIESATAAKSAAKLAPSPSARPKAGRRISEAVDVYMVDRARRCRSDQARRAKAACLLFVELQNDPLVGDVTRDQLRTFRDDVLPKVPAEENRIRRKFGTTASAL